MNIYDKATMRHVCFYGRAFVHLSPRPRTLFLCAAIAMIGGLFQRVCREVAIVHRPQYLICETRIAYLVKHLAEIFETE